MSLSSQIQWSQHSVLVNFPVFPHRPQRGLDTVLCVVFAIANLLHWLACCSLTLSHRVARRLSPSGESFTSGFSHGSCVFEEEINRTRGLLIPSILPQSLFSFASLPWGGSEQMRQEKKKREAWMQANGRRETAWGRTGTRGKRGNQAAGLRGKSNA